VAFSLRHNHAVQTHLQTARVTKNKRRGGSGLWPAFIENAIHIDIEALVCVLWGLGRLATFFSRSQADLQSSNVNGRNTFGQIVTHAESQAYKDVLFHGRHPAVMYVLGNCSVFSRCNVHSYISTKCFPEDVYA